MRTKNNLLQRAADRDLDEEIGCLREPLYPARPRPTWAQAWMRTMDEDEDEDEWPEHMWLRRVYLSTHLSLRFNDTPSIITYEPDDPRVGQDRFWRTA